MSGTIETTLGNYRFNLNPTQLPTEKEIKDLTFEELAAAATNLDNSPVNHEAFEAAYKDNGSLAALATQLAEQPRGVLQARTELSLVDVDCNSRPAGEQQAPAADIPPATGDPTASETPQADGSATSEAHQAPAADVQAQLQAELARLTAELKTAEKTTTAALNKAATAEAKAATAEAKATDAEAKAEAAAATQTKKHVVERTDLLGSWTNWIVGIVGGLGAVIAGLTFASSDSPGKSFFGVIGGIVAGIAATFFSTSFFTEAKPEGQKPAPATPTPAS